MTMMVDAHSKMVDVHTKMVDVHTKMVASLVLQMTTMVDVHTKMVDVHTSVADNVKGLIPVLGLPRRDDVEELLDDRPQTQSCLMTVHKSSFRLFHRFWLFHSFCRT
jgi:hypothetical protein